MKCLKIAVISASLALAGNASAFETGSLLDGASVGYQSTLYASGLSIKKPINERVSFQGIAGLISTVNSVQARGVYHFNQQSAWSPYAYGSAGFWSVSTGYASANGTFFGAGAGAEYSLGNLSEQLLRWTTSAELSVGSADFGGIVGNSSLSLGLGLHYKF